MPTVTDIVTNIWPISQFLASNDISKGSLYGAPVNPNLPIQLHIIGNSVKYRYDYEEIDNGNAPSTDLIHAANYLFSFCDKYGLEALSLEGSGGQVPGTSSLTNVYSYPISGYYIGTFDGEDNFQISLPAGAKIVQVFKSSNWLENYNWSWVQPLFSLLNGNSLGQDEKLSYLYVVPI